MFPEWVNVRGLPCVEYNSAALEGGRGGTEYGGGPAAPHVDAWIWFCCDEEALRLAPMGEA